MPKINNEFSLRNSKYLFGFSLIPEISPTRFEKICKKFESIEQAWNAPLSELTNVLGEKAAEKIWLKKEAINLEQELKKLTEENLNVISRKLPFKDFKGINTKLFPNRLNQISNAPFILFAKGNTELLNKNQLAIVGSRRPTHYGKQALEKLGPEIAISGLKITSGMAMGVDTFAHRAALDNEKPTIAVLGSGLGKKILNKSLSHRLAKEIVQKNGLLVSEYPPNYPASKFTFPARNRIISGLSLGVLVVEAAERSGTLITARHALEQNREILSLPGNIFSTQSVGTNKLIKQGATPVTSAQDIFEALNWKAVEIQKNKKNQTIEDEVEKIIYKKLSFEPKPLDKLVSECSLDISAISIKLSIMELKGIVKNVNGGYIKN